MSKEKNFKNLDIWQKTLTLPTSHPNLDNKSLDNIFGVHPPSLLQKFGQSHEKVYV